MSAISKAHGTLRGVHKMGSFIEEIRFSYPNSDEIYKLRHEDYPQGQLQDVAHAGELGHGMIRTMYKYGMKGKK